MSSMNLYLLTVEHQPYLLIRGNWEVFQSGVPNVKGEYLVFAESPQDAQKIFQTHGEYYYGLDTYTDRAEEGGDYLQTNFLETRDVSEDGGSPLLQRFSHLVYLRDSILAGRPFVLPLRS